jgi:DNA-directed RNA polymerase subunit beta'
VPREDTFGRLLVKSALPPGVPPPPGPLDKKTVAALYGALAARAPDRFRATTKTLSDLGAEAGHLTGGYSFGPEHLRPHSEVRAATDRLGLAARAVLADPALSDKERNDKLVHLALAHTGPITDAVRATTAGNPLALQVESGAKGKVENLKSLMAGDTLYLDSEYNPIPFPITSSFYSGLRPHEYAAGTYGARLAISLTKLGTAQGGYLAKRLRNLTHRLLVTARDAEHTDPDDPVTGYRVPLSDPDNEGAVLATRAGTFPRHTVLHRSVIADLNRQGLTHVLVRSPMVGGPADGGVYGLDVGVRERGGIAPIGDQVGLASADALAEPITQTIIGSKHTGGVAGSTAGQQGFPVLDKLLSIPTEYGGAVHAETDGTLGSVRRAPQGGHYVAVGGIEHYVPPDRSITAAHGAHVEAGDPLTDGLENPAKYVEHKGIGEARRRFVDAFMRASQEAGFRPHRRNLELVARGYFDAVRHEAEYGDLVPGDVDSYTTVAAHYEPRPGHERKRPADAEGMYLERPVLHYTIGTRVRPSVVRALEESGVARIPVHKDPPPFTPVAIRSHDVLNFDRDPLTRMLGSGLEKNLIRGVARGDVSDTRGTSFVPALAEGTHFGTVGKTRAWDPSKVEPVEPPG